jgi:7,8-dihydropterin-6-yl-methyl-4-(beta-D-ribofuranosyl)aminobenzene 5'-phosphate synthase
MDSLSIELEDIDIVILSHEHWDHTGGLRAFLERNPNVTVYVPRSFKSAFKRQVIDAGAEVIEVGEPMRICRSVYSTGELGDSIREQSLVVCTDRGMIVITGCAHPGIGLIVKKARELIPDEVLLAMGGFHLMRAGEDEISDIVASLREAGVLNAGPCHCSGDNARHLFRAAYGDRYLEIGVGTTLTSADYK